MLIIQKFTFLLTNKSINRRYYLVFKYSNYLFRFQQITTEVFVKLHSDIETDKIALIRSIPKKLINHI
jgi:hypothetical protein